MLMPETKTALDAQLFNETFKKVIEEIRLFIVGIDEKGKIIYANNFFIKTTGYTAAEVLDKDIFDIFIPVNKIETFDKKIKAIMTNNYSMQSENPILKKDGTVLYVDWSNFPITAGNKPVGVLSIGTDITSHIEIVNLLSLNEKTMRDRAELFAKQNQELEKLEKALEQEKKGVEKKVEERTAELIQEKARLLASINSFPYGFLVTDNQDNVVVANETLGSIFGVKRIEWHINDLRDFLSGAVNFPKFYGLVKTSKKPYLMRDIDLERKFLEVYIAPIFLSPLSNETIGNIILVTDITEQKIIERSKDEFFSIASHELRTPLTAIRGNAELLKKHYETQINDKNFSEMIADIGTSSVRLIGLVNEFLNTSRLEQGKMQFKQEEVDIAEVVQDVIKELQPNAGLKNLTLKWNESQTNLPKVLADRDRVREVILNLISNAITYTDRGGCVISAAMNDPKYVKISVSDSGKGIPPQSQNLLFRKFQQANTNIYTRDSARSTGLGLYISKLMVEAMRGSIFLEKSQVGEGSTFSFTLPVA
jgi:two-component system phosphate regulon sensor histidine kinase PhoR